MYFFIKQISYLLLLLKLKFVPHTHVWSVNEPLRELRTQYKLVRGHALITDYDFIIQLILYGLTPRSAEQI